MKKKNHYFAGPANSGKLQGSLPPWIFEHNRKTQEMREAQNAVDVWGAARRAFLSDCQFQREMKEKQITKRNTYLAPSGKVTRIEEDWDTGWGKNRKGGL